MLINKLSPSGEVAPKMVADLNKGFTQEELAFIQTQQLPLPADILYPTENWHSRGRYKNSKGWERYLHTEEEEFL